MELTFTKSTNGFIADYTATTHFNIHIEGAGSVSLFRRTSGESWDFVKTLQGSVIDEDVAVNIPKDYRVTTTATPTMAVVTFKA